MTKSVALEKVEAELKRLDYNQRNIEKINRDKILDYEKKMSTLNNEINLTQQLYKVFMETKAKKSYQWLNLIVCVKWRLIYQVII